MRSDTRSITVWIRVLGVERIEACRRISLRKAGGIDSTLKERRRIYMAKGKMETYDSRDPQWEKR